MRTLILPRYILREHIGPFFFAFSTITLLFLLNMLFRELSRILSKGLPWNIVLEFFVLNMAWMIALSVPMAVLTATLMAFGRMAADNEIAAMEANGVSIYTIIAPVAVAALLLSIGLVWFNNNVLPDFNHRTRLLASDIARKRPTINIEPGVWYDDIPNYGLLVKDLEDSANVTKARNLLINDYTSPTLSRTISARRGTIGMDTVRAALVLTLHDGEMQEIDMQKPNEFRRVTFPKHVIAIVVDDMFLNRSESEYRGDREKSAQQMRQDVANNREESEKVRGRINTVLAVNVPAGLNRLMAIPRDSALVPTVPVLQPQKAKIVANTPAEPKPHAPDVRLSAPVPPPANGAQLSPLAKRLHLHRQLLHQVERETSLLQGFERKSKVLTVEIEKKYSIPVACIVFVLIGAPLGIMSRRGGLATGGGISLVFFLLYWTSLVGGEDLADREIVSPFWAMWSANIIVGAGGLYFLWRAAHDQTGVSVSRIRQKVQRLFRLSRRVD
jgi:lipopolysaccharide export system permease protein